MKKKLKQQWLNAIDELIEGYKPPYTQAKARKWHHKGYCPLCKIIDNSICADCIYVILFGYSKDCECMENGTKIPWNWQERKLAKPRRQWLINTVRPMVEAIEEE